MAAIDVDRLRQRAVSAFRAFTPAQLVLAGLLGVVALVGVLWFAKWVSTPSYSVLYSGLDPKDTSAVTTKLSADKVPYKLSGNGTTIEVPASDLDKERVALAAAGLPKGDTGGWDTLGKESLTTSSFRQQVDYQRALEGEIAKTLGSIDGVDDAQVHLVLPEERLFTDDQRNARASVLLTTSKPLMSEQVQAVISTVASAVPDLDPNNVTVTDNNGRLLSSHAGGGDEQMAQQANFEDSQTARAQSMLDQLVGPGHAVVRVSATLDFDKQHSQVKTVDPTKQATTGSEKSTETYVGSGNGTAQGALTTTDPTQPLTTTGTTNGNNYSKSTETTTTEPSERVDDITKAQGTVSRQSVAVVMDASLRSLPPNAEVQQLVAAAVGLDPKRGDTIVVSSSNFDNGNKAAAKPKSGGLLGSNGKTLSTAVGAVMLVVITLLLARAARRPKVKDIELPEVLPALPANKATAALPAGGDERAALPAGSSGGSGPLAIPGQRSGDDPVDLLHAVESNPDDVTHLLRGWLSESGSETR